MIIFMRDATDNSCLTDLILYCQHKNKLIYSQIQIAINLKKSPSKSAVLNQSYFALPFLP